MTLSLPEHAVWQSAPTILGKILLGTAMDSEVNQLALDVQSADINILREALKLEIDPDFYAFLMPGNTNYSSSSEKHVKLTVGDALRIFILGKNPKTSFHYVIDTHHSYDAHSQTLIKTDQNHSQAQAVDRLIKTPVGKHKHVVLGDMIMSFGEAVGLQWFVSRVLCREVARKFRGLEQKQITDRLENTERQINEQIENILFLAQKRGLIEWKRALSGGVETITDILENLNDEPYHTMRGNKPAHLWEGLIHDEQRQKLWDEVDEDLNLPQNGQLNSRQTKTPKA